MFLKVRRLSDGDRREEWTAIYRTAGGRIEFGRYRAIRSGKNSGWWDIWTWSPSKNYWICLYPKTDSQGYAYWLDHMAQNSGDEE